MPALWQGPDPLNLGPSSSSDDSDGGGGGGGGFLPGPLFGGGSNSSSDSDDVETVESDDDQDDDDVPTMAERNAAFAGLFGGAGSVEDQIGAPDPADVANQPPPQQSDLPVSPAVVIAAAGVGVLLLRGGL